MISRLKKVCNSFDWYSFVCICPASSHLILLTLSSKTDLGGEQVFVSNFKPIYEEEMKDLTERVDFYELFTPPIKNHMVRSLKEGGVNMCSAKPRIWNGQQTKNPRYLQVRPDVARPRDKYLAQLGSKCTICLMMFISLITYHICFCQHTTSTSLS